MATVFWGDGEVFTYCWGNGSSLVRVKVLKSELTSIKISLFVTHLFWFIEIKILCDVMTEDIIKRGKIEMNEQKVRG